jgi:hypothetical protein
MSEPVAMNQTRLINDPAESVCAEADRLVSGDRRSTYGHPLDNFTDTAALLNVCLRKKLKVELVAEDVAIIMTQLKLAREINQHKRDNLVDACGYLKCLELVIDERKARNAVAQATERLIENSLKDDPTPSETTTLERRCNDLTAPKSPASDESWRGQHDDPAIETTSGSVGKARACSCVACRTYGG